MATGFEFTYHGKKGVEVSPCMFCKHRGKMTVEEPCYSCIDIIDLAVHKPNRDTNFASFVPLTDAHAEVIKYEINKEAE